jgi:hypothetical protein
MLKAYIDYLWTEYQCYCTFLVPGSAYDIYDDQDINFFPEIKVHWERTLKIV